MAIERTIVNIYPPALERSITGDIISMIRVMPEAGSPLEIVGAGIFAFTVDLARDICGTLTPPQEREEAFVQDKFKEVLRDYVSYAPRKYKVARVMNLVLEGEDAVRRVSRLMGDIRRRDGVTVLGRFGFYHPPHEGHPADVEFPASAPSWPKEAAAQIDLFWNKYRHLGGPQENAVRYYPEEQPKLERTLAIIKPNAFEKPNDPRTGDVIDAMAKTGAYIIGAKVICPKPEEMAVFYEVHREKKFFGELVDFMSGKRSLALLYEGVEARQRVRATALEIVRGAYTDDIMANTVHTSDSEGDFRRESGVVNFAENILPPMPDPCALKGL
jgi:nucleoside-diphosphate kinase